MDLVLLISVFYCNCFFVDFADVVLRPLTNLHDVLDLGIMDNSLKNSLKSINLNLYSKFQLKLYNYNIY